jgi:hypothetical protein
VYEFLKFIFTQQTFAYDSEYWTSHNVYNVGAIPQGITTRQEMKLQTYSLFPVTKLCLGMKAGDDDTRWITLPNTHNATSLYSVISSNEYQPTNLGRDAWKSLVNDSSLQIYCNREGFNVNVADQWVSVRRNISHTLHPFFSF